jgi:hypothetical protein
MRLNDPAVDTLEDRERTIAGIAPESDRGRPYTFTTGLKLLEDFWREVKRVLNERGIPNDL